MHLMNLSKKSGNLSMYRKRKKYPSKIWFTIDFVNNATDTNSPENEKII